LDGIVDYILYVDNYINLYLSNIQQITGSYRLSSFKIPLIYSSGVIMFDNEFNSFKQFIDLANSSQIIDKIKIEVYDRFNNLILCNNADYSLTLELEYNNN